MIYAKCNCTGEEEAVTEVDTVGLKPPLSNVDYLRHEHITHEATPGLQEPSYSSGYIHMIRC